MQLLERTIRLSEPSLTTAEHALAQDALTSGWISGVGPYVGRFETALSARFHRHAVACSNGTTALELTLRALGIGAEDEVIVPALTFVAPAAAVASVGARPVFADIDPISWTLDPLDVMRKCTPRTRAVIAVDLIGHPADYDALRKLDHFGIVLIEDAAEAHGALYKGCECGSFGAVSTFSFFANKTITSGEGGAVLTQHAALAERVHILAHHGQTPGQPYWHEVVGTNARLTNLNAAIGVAQVERWDALVAARNRVRDWYEAHLPAGIGRRPVADWATYVNWMTTVAHPERDRVVAALNERGVEARRIFYPLPNLPPYQDRQRYPVAEAIAREAFWLPTSATMTESDVAYVCDVLRQVL